MRTCEVIISSCARHFAHLVKFIFRTTEFYSDLYQVAVVKGFVQSEELRNSISQIHNKFAEMKKLELLSLFSTYEYAFHNSVKRVAQASICEMMTDLANEPFIFKILPTLQFIEQLSRELKYKALKWVVNSGILLFKKSRISKEAFWQRLADFVDPEDFQRAKTATESKSQDHIWTIQYSKRLLVVGEFFTPKAFADLKSIFSGDALVQSEGIIYHSDHQTVESYPQLQLANITPMDINMDLEFP